MSLAPFLMARARMLLARRTMERLPEAVARSVACRFLFFVLLDLHAAENFVLQFLEALHLEFGGFRLASFLRFSSSRLPCLIGFPLLFLEAHELRINRIHELLGNPLPYKPEVR